MMFWPIVLLALGGCGVEKGLPEQVMLSDGWTFQSTDGRWLPAKVPGNIHLDLLRNGLIPDPFQGQNEEAVQWVELSDWRYKCALEPPPLLGDWVLEFKGLDTYAAVLLNGDTLLKADNMHRSWSVPAAEMAFGGSDTLEVVFSSPVVEGQRRLDRSPWSIPVSNEMKPQGQQVSAVVRKAMYHFGWDWGPRLVTSGIWKPIKWVRRDVELPAFALDLEAVGEDTAHYTLAFEAPVEDVQLALSLGGKPVAAALEYRGDGVYHLAIPNPALWWPHGMGEQPLYDAALSTADGRQAAHTFGIRTLEWRQAPDVFGESFQCVVNGVPVQARGANVIPADFFINRGEAELDRMVADAVAANMNMLRVWGGAVYGSEAFYDRCDAAGLLVWQDFMSACAMVPGDAAWNENFLGEARQQVRRLRNRTSLALWCGNNETEKAWKTWGWQEIYGMDAADSTAAWAAYLSLFEQRLPDLVEEEGGGFYWPSSPHPVDPALHRKAGDQHDWGVWFAKNGFDFYSDDGGRFASEFGLQSLPHRATLAEVGVQSFADSSLQFRQRSKMDWLEPGFDGWDMMRFYAGRYFLDPDAVEAAGRDRLDRWIHLTQLTQAEGLRQAIERHRCSGGRTAGSLYWQLDDVWPTVSWSTVDHAGRWKLAHHAVRQANQPVRLLWDRDRTDALRMIGQNLGPDPWRGKLAWAQLSIEGDTLKTLELEVDLPPMGQRDKPVMTTDMPEEAAVLTWSLRTESGAWTDRGAATLAPAASYDWQDVQVRVEVGEGGVWLACDTLVCGVRLTASAAGHFADNGFILLPRERRWIGFEGPDGQPVSPGEVELTHLGHYRSPSR